MSKVKIGSKASVVPSPVILVGAMIKDKPNYNVLGNFGVICLGSVTVMISSHKSHYTNDGINKNKCFSINIPHTEIAQVTDYCGLFSGRDVDKSNIFTSFYGELENAPMIEECLINLECKVIDKLLISDMEMFIAEVVQTYVKEDILINDRIDMNLLKPLLLYGRSYTTIDKPLSQAFNIGKNLK